MIMEALKGFRFDAIMTEDLEADRTVKRRPSSALARASKIEGYFQLRLCNSAVAPFRRRLSTFILILCDGSAGILVLAGSYSARRLSLCLLPTSHSLQKTRHFWRLSSTRLHNDASRHQYLGFQAAAKDILRTGELTFANSGQEPGLFSELDSQVLSSSELRIRSFKQNVFEFLAASQQALRESSRRST